MEDEVAAVSQIDHEGGGGGGGVVPHTRRREKIGTEKTRAYAHLGPWLLMT